MSVCVQLQLTAFARDVLEGLSARHKKLSPRYFYDDIGSALFEAITLLPEYGLSRADERLLRVHANDIACHTGTIGITAELGSGSGKKTRHVLEALGRKNKMLTYRPIDVSQAALRVCEKELEHVCEIKSICGDWLQGLTAVAQERMGNERLLVLFVGSSIGNLDRAEIGDFLCSLRSCLAPGDFFLLGADLVKDVSRMLAAYDDPAGVTAAFNRNLLGRINRELDADFDLTAFAHEARWNAAERSIEMHLRSRHKQSVHLAALDTFVHFESGETVWTESSRKFTCSELDDYARSSGFQAETAWIDQEWPFAETLWRAK